MQRLSSLIENAQLVLGKNRGKGLGAVLLFILYFLPFLILAWFGPVAASTAVVSVIDALF